MAVEATAGSCRRRSTGTKTRAPGHTLPNRLMILAVMKGGSPSSRTWDHRGRSASSRPAPNGEG